MLILLAALFGSLPVLAQRPSEGIAAFRRYVKVKHEFGLTPVVSAAWLPVLRWAAFEQQWAEEAFARRVAFVLAHHEWLALRAADRSLQRRAAVWRLMQAAEHFRSLHADAATQAAPESRQLILLVSSYMRDVDEDDVAIDPRDDDAVRARMRREFATVFDPSRAEGPNLKIQDTIQPVFERAQQTLVRAAAGFEQAESTLRSAYGDIRKPEAREQLSKPLQQLLFGGESFADVERLLRASLDGRPLPDDFPALVEKHGKLWSELELGEATIASLVPNEAALGRRAPSEIDDRLDVNRWDDRLREHLRQLGSVQADLKQLERDELSRRVVTCLDQMAGRRAEDAAPVIEIAYHGMALLAELARRGEEDSSEKAYMTGIVDSPLLSGTLAMIFEPLSDHLKGSVTPHWVERFKRLDEELIALNLDGATPPRDFGPEFEQLLRELSRELAPYLDPWREQLENAAKSEPNLAFFVQANSGGAEDGAAEATDSGEQADYIAPTPETGGGSTEDTSTTGSSAAMGPSRGSTGSQAATGDKSQGDESRDRKSQDVSRSEGRRDNDRGGGFPRASGEARVSAAPTAGGGTTKLDSDTTLRNVREEFERLVERGQATRAVGLLQRYPQLRSEARSSGEHLAVGVALMRHHADRAFALLSEGSPSLSSDVARSQQWWSDRGATLRGLEAAESELNESSSDAGAKAREIAAMIRFVRATRAELEAYRDAVTVQQLRYVVEHVATEAVNEGGAIHRGVLGPAAQIDEQMNERGREIDEHTHAIAIERIKLLALLEIAVALSNDFVDYMLAKDDRERTLESHNKSLPDALIEAGFAEPQLREVTADELPQPNSEPYPSYRVFEYLMSGGLAQVRGVEAAARRLRDQLVARGREQLGKTLGKALIEWLESHREELAAMTVQRHLQRFVEETLDK